MIVAGLTGNFGMGKSFVLSLFRKLGAVTLSSDRLVAILLNQENVVKRIQGLLGDEVILPDGKVNKKAVAEKIFGDGKSRKDLEALLHPMVFQMIEDFIRGMKNKKRILVVEVPLLFEAGARERFNRVITVYAAEETALKRLEKAGFSRSEALARLGSQMPVDEKIRLSDYVVDNNGPAGRTEEQVERIYKLLHDEMKSQS